MQPRVPRWMSEMKILRTRRSRVLTGLKCSFPRDLDGEHYPKSKLRAGDESIKVSRQFLDLSERIVEADDPQFDRSIFASCNCEFTLDCVLGGAGVQPTGLGIESTVLDASGYWTAGRIT